jgi:nitroreductase
MDAMEAILTRRSVREYSDEPVSEAVVGQILRAAMQAPSAGNQQPWHFVVVRDRALLDAVPTFHPHAQMLRQAPAAILVCADTRDLKYADLWVQDCAAAAQNLLLAAHALGLGAVWIALHPYDARSGPVCALFGLPPQVRPLCLVAIGHPGSPTPIQDRFQPERVHRDRWE